jgi:hypothetical protein
MFAQLLSTKGDRIIIELASGKQLAGTVIEADQKYLRLQTAEGICVVIVSAILVVWEKTGASPAAEIAYQSLGVKDQKSPVDLEQMCTLMHARPCTTSFSQPCTQAYAQPCYQMFGGRQPSQPCYQMFGGQQPSQPCYQMFGGQQPCPQAYAQNCPQAFMPQSEPYGCYGRFGHFGRPCYGPFGGGGFGGGGFPFPSPYPYPPYPYPPYPPYPYPYPYNDQVEGAAQPGKEAQK